MTLTLFITLLTVASLISSLLTEAIKSFVEDPKSTIIVAIISAIAGWGGGAATYILMGITFTPANIVCLVLLAPAVFLTATVGYDKVVEIIKQIGGIIEK